jgi:hypothetical protein
MTGRDQNKKYHMEDDGHTIADMSGLPGRQPFFWRREGTGGERGNPQGPSGGADPGRSFGGGAPSSDENAPVYVHEQEDLSIKNRLSMVMGALGAALAIGLVYLVIFALVIFLLLLAWNK